jgi:membrane associated rhomboid family serine protease
MPLPNYRNTFSYYGGFPTGVKWLLIVNSAIFVALFLGGEALWQHLAVLLSAVPFAIVKRFYIWELFTYMFVHRGLTHWLFNMLTLWMFGAPVEGSWGTRRFLKFYIYCGIAAGACDAIVRMALPESMGLPFVGTIGASGAIFGLLVAYAVLFPDTPVLMFLLFPMKAKTMVMIFIGIELLMSMGPNTGVATIAHLGGAAFGYLYLKRKLPTFRVSPPDVGGAYQRWKMARAKKKFQVYLRNRGGGRGPWVN